MAEKFDVSSRLAEGRPAVENLQQYVWACHQQGYQHPDLTLHAVQVRDWYGSEDGMDLAALHRDWLAIDAATHATQDAMAVQDRQLSVLSEAWQGAGGQASRDFLRRHGEASAAVAAAVRTAAEAMDALQESLWRAVDAKVDSVVAIEDRAAAHRAEWLAAAESVTSGAGDRASAGAVVDQSVTPFVDGSVRTDVLTALRPAVSSVAGAYQRAAAEIAAEYSPAFEVPGDLGPVPCPPVARHRDGEICCEERDPDTPLVGPAAASPAGAAAASPTAPAAASPTAPAAWSGAPAAAATPALPASPMSMALPPAPPEAPPVPAAPPMAPMPSLGGMGSGMPDLGGGLSGLGQQFADTLGGLLGGADGSAAGLPDLDDPFEPDRSEDEEELDSDADEGVDRVTGEDTEDTEDTEAEDADAEDPEAEAADSAAAEAAEEADVAADADASAEAPVVAGLAEPQACVDAEVPAEPAPAATPAPPPAEPLPPVDPPADPLSAEQTPCAIAADELPQIGDPPE